MDPRDTVAVPFSFNRVLCSVMGCFVVKRETGMPVTGCTQ